MYILTDDNAVLKFPYSLEELRIDNSNTSFPRQMSEDELAEWGVFAVEDQSPPAFNERAESIEIGTPTLVDGKWVRNWSVVAATPAEVEARDMHQARLVRSTRSQILVRTDYTQLADFSGSSQDQAAFIAYRQNLRDLPQQPGFPWAVEWPMLGLESP